MKLRFSLLLFVSTILGCFAQGEMDEEARALRGMWGDSNEEGERGRHGGGDGMGMGGGPWWDDEDDEDENDEDEDEEDRERGGDRMGGGGGGYGMMGGANRGSGNFMGVIHNLLDHREDIKRQVTQTNNGVQTRTWSNDPEVAEWIKDHVDQMISLMESGHGIRRWDPLFKALADNQDDIDADVTELNKGVRVRLSGSTSCARNLARYHAAAVSAFIDEGYDEVHEEHEVPEECDD